MSEFKEKRAVWIGHWNRGQSRKADAPAPSLRLRKTFELESLPKKAVAKISGLGCYLLSVNGKKVGDDILSPAFTDYEKRVLYLEYDVTSFLKKGKNVVSVELGGGFFNQAGGDAWGFYCAPWRESPKLWFALSGDRRTILVSDKTWKASVDGPCVYSSLRVGEFYDARKEDGWETLDFDDSGWSDAVRAVPPSGRLIRQTMPPIRMVGRLKPMRVMRGKNGVIVDFGRNIAGFVEVSATGKKGDVLDLTLGETLSAAGDEVDVTHLSSYSFDPRFAHEQYILKGEGEETWRPSFTYYGFRYAEVHCPESAECEAVAIEVHTDLKKTGFFQCDDEMLNWFSEASENAIASNYHGIPTDCPHREKLGWTGDAWCSAENASITFDMDEAYLKFLQDIVDTQRPNGQICCIAPTCGWGYLWGYGPSFDFSLFAPPSLLYRTYGDARGFRVAYKAQERYLSFARSQKENGLVCYGLGDWDPPKIEGIPSMSLEFCASCFYAAMLDLHAEIGERKGDAKASSYRKEAREVRRALHEKYVHGGGVDTDAMTSYAFAVYFGIVKGKEAEEAARRLALLAEKNDYAPLFGIFGARTVFEVLSSCGHSDAAYALMQRKEYPSFGHWKELGATTLWETFEGNQSRNHHMYSSPMGWIYRWIGGIQNEGIAYDRILLKPYLHSEDCHACTSVRTRRGLVEFDWSYRGSLFQAEIAIPQGSSATLEVLGRKVELKAGRQRVEIPGSEEKK